MTQDGAGPIPHATVEHDPVPLARAVLVDADEVWRVGLRLLLQDAGIVRVVEEAGDVDSALGPLRRVQPELVIVDVVAHRNDPITGLRRLVAAAPGSQVVVTARSLPDDVVVEAVRLGVQGIVTKGCDAQELVQTVCTTLRGDCALDPGSTSALVRTVRTPRQAADPFTGREREVLSLVTRGLPNRLIGRELFITEATVKFHLRNIMDKLGVRRRAEVVGVALRGGLVPVDEPPVAGWPGR